ncbi:putative PHD finger domain protein [Aspergillus stella-maris]|uniref:putative PHD finger domain protein n=1 Tax=Aspergillus stella-maris TaxID=1810926 RepID=UPI003CCE5192
MADEPRRSGRSTKGQHKNLELINDTPAKKTKKAQSKDKASKPSAEPTPAPSEPEEEIIRCICGEYEEEEDVERDMICCDKCLAWQHNDCMGLTFPKGQEPDEYYCELCKPEDHKELLEKMARGEKPWEEVAERRRKEAEELKQAKRKKGKKGGKRGRPSEVKAEASTPARTTAARPSATPSETPAASTTTPAAEKDSHAPEEKAPSSQKRKFSEQPDVSTPESGPKSKQQKVSSPAAAATPQAKPASVKNEPPAQPSVAAVETTKPKSFEDISIPARRNAANALAKVFVDQLSDALARGSFKLPKDKSGEDVGQQLGLSVEDALYQTHCGGSGEPTEDYKLQLRTILFNVKKNPSLRDRLLVGSLSPGALSSMSTQDMASEELQQKDAEIKAEAERQHIIIQEQGPRIRRTHKGEEVVEDDQHNVSSEPVFSAGPRRSLAETDGSPGAQSPTTAGPKQTETDGETAADAQEGTPSERKNHDEHFPPRSHSPGTGQEQVFPEVQTHIREPIPHGKVQADAEIDQLLKEDDEPDSPPYSPKDNHEEGSIWHGKVAMKPISAEFSSYAKHVGGADLSLRIPWSQLVPSLLNVDGRIDIKLASDYLCGLRYSSSTDVTVISIASPDSPKDKAGFDSLFEYFQQRQRYGVVGKHPLPAVKDTYLIPIEAGSTKKPEFIELLENNGLEDTTSERILLVVFAIKTGESNTPSVQPPSHHSSQEPAASASPLTVAGTPQQANFATPGPRPSLPGQQYPPTPSPAFPAGAQAPIPYNQQPHPQAQAQQQPPTMTQPNSFQAPQPAPNQAPVTGLAAAIQVLGGQANSPAIQQLLQSAPNATTQQLNIVREILLRQPQAAADYSLLMNELVNATTTNGNGNGHAPQSAQPPQ